MRENMRKGWCLLITNAISSIHSLVISSPALIWTLHEPETLFFSPFGMNVSEASMSNPNFSLHWENGPARLV